MVESYAIRTIPFFFIANVEEVVEEMDFESCDADYNYDEDSDGNMKKRKRKYPRFDRETNIPHFSLGMVFTSKNQFVMVIKRYGLATQISMRFKKSKENRVRVNCGWPSCPWIIYETKISICSRFQIITYHDDHQCAQNR